MFGALMGFCKEIKELKAFRITSLPITKYYAYSSVQSYPGYVFMTLTLLCV